MAQVPESVIGHYNVQDREFQSKLQVWGHSWNLDGTEMEAWGNDE